MKKINTLLLMLLASSLSSAIAGEANGDTNSYQMSYQAFKHLPQRFLFVREVDFRVNVLAGNPLLELIEGKKCLVVLTRIEPKYGKQQTFDVNTPKTVAQVLREAGMRKEATQIRLFKRNEIAQSDPTAGLLAGGIADLRVEPGDILIEVQGNPQHK